MADTNDVSDEESPNYKAPPEKTLEEIVNADKEDESLRKYKETLLGQVSASAVIVDPADQRRVLVKALALVVDGREDVILELSAGVTENLKKKPFTIKEGIPYKIRIDFFVQREIVTGLKYVQKIYRHGIPVEKMAHMIGSYPPKETIQSYTTPQEEMPSGMLARGTYTVSSLFTDDDKNEHLKWEWSFELKKDWED